jgi:hypothetical protein
MRKLDESNALIVKINNIFSGLHQHFLGQSGWSWAEVKYAIWHGEFLFQG